jgi:hypothetical protein
VKTENDEVELGSHQHFISSAIAARLFDSDDFPNTQVLDHDMTAYFEEINNDPKLIQKPAKHV